MNTLIFWNFDLTLNFEEIVFQNCWYNHFIDLPSPLSLLSTFVNNWLVPSHPFLLTQYVNVLQLRYKRYSEREISFDFVLEKKWYLQTHCVFVFWVFLVPIFSHLDWIQTEYSRKTQNTDTFHAVIVILEVSQSAYSGESCQRSGALTEHYLNYSSCSFYSYS